MDTNGDGATELDADKLFPANRRPYFTDTGIAAAISNRYVAWLDLMGASNTMARSLSKAANYIGKIHLAAFEAENSAVTTYPVIDGCYFVSEDRRVCKPF